MLGLPSMQLITIAFSHYNEKARWALDRFGVEYRERRCMPMFHFPAVLWATRGRGGRADRGSTRLSTPVLVTDDGERLCDSAQIARYASDRYGTPATSLYPAEHLEELEALERRLHERVGPHTRRIAYYHVLRTPGVLAALARNNVGRVQASAFVATVPLWRAALRRGLGIGRVRAEASLVRVRDELAALDAQLGDRRYLVGDRFTTADLTAATMLAPVLLPTRAEGYAATLVEPGSVPSELAALVDELRGTRIGRHCLRMFRHERQRAQ